MITDYSNNTNLMQRLGFNGNYYKLIRYYIYIFKDCLWRVNKYSIRFNICGFYSHGRMFVSYDIFTLTRN